MIRFINKSVLLSLLFLMIIPGCGHRNEKDFSLKKIKERGYFIAGVDEQTAPMCFRDMESNEYAGFFIEFIKEIARRSGVKVQFKTISADKAAENLLNGEIDIYWNAATFADIENTQVIPINPYIDSRQVILVRKNGDISTVSQLTGKKAGFYQKSNSEVAYNSSGSFSRKIREIKKYPSISTALSDLASGSIDAVIMDEIIAGWNMALKPGIFRMLDDDLGHEVFAIGARKSDNEFKTELEKNIHGLTGDNIGKKMSIKWFGTNILLH